MGVMKDCNIVNAADKQMKLIIRSAENKTLSGFSKSPRHHQRLHNIMNRLKRLRINYEVIDAQLRYYGKQAISA